MWQEEYVAEKLRDLEREQLTRRALDTTTPQGRPVFGPVITFAGRALRRFGEGLESWASPRPADPDCRCAEAETS